jgi:transcriptional regulator with XRE-family HTH domain
MERSRIPNRLKRYRRLAGYSQKSAARILRLPSASSLSRWEKGRNFPSIPLLFKLSLLYKTHPIHLYQDLWQRLKLEVEESIPKDAEPINSNEKFYL